MHTWTQTGPSSGEDNHEHCPEPHMLLKLNILCQNCAAIKSHFKVLFRIIFIIIFGTDPNVCAVLHDQECSFYCGRYGTTHVGI